MTKSISHVYNLSLDIEPNMFKHVLMILLHDCRAHEFSKFLTFEFGEWIIEKKSLNLQAMNERHDVDVSMPKKVISTMLQVTKQKHREEQQLVDEELMLNCSN